MKKFLYVLLSILILSSRLYAWDFDDDDEISQNIVKETKVTVKVSRPIKKTSVLNIDVPAQIRLSNICAITSKTEGYITTYVGRGDLIREGEIIAKVRNPILNLEKNSLKSRVKLIEREISNLNKRLKNYKELLRLGLISQNDLISLKNSLLNKRMELRSLQYQLKTLQIQENNYKIISSCNGFILEIIPSKAYVKIGTQIAKVYDPQRTYLSLYLPVEYLPEIKTNKEIKVKIHKRWYIGKIKGIIPIAERNLVEVKVSDINGLSLPLKYKFTAEVSIKKLTGFVVPKEALVVKGNKPALFIVKNNKAIIKQVKVLKDLGNKVLVTGNLSSEDLVVIYNSYLLQNGTEVTINE